MNDQVSVVSFNDGTKYAGEVKGNIPHGRGIMLFDGCYVRYHKGWFRNGEFEHGRQLNDGIGSPVGGGLGCLSRKDEGFFERLEQTLGISSEVR